MAEIEMYSQVSSLDDILRQYSAFTRGIMTGVGPMKGKDSIKMKFPFPGIMSLKGEVVNQSVKVARETLAITKRDVVAKIRKKYWNLLFIQKALKITEETAGLLKRLESAATTRYKAGRNSYQDVIKVRIRYSTLLEDIVTFQQKRRNIETEILEILDLDPTIHLETPNEIKPDQNRPNQDFLYKKALENRQELRRLRARISKMERMIEMAETMILPPFTLNFSLYEDEAVMKTGSTAMKASFPESVKSYKGSGLPKMPWYGTDDAYIRQTKHNLLALREDLKRAEAKTSILVRNAWFNMDKALREFKLFENTIVTLSRSALEVSTRGYEAGRVSFADVIGSHTNWLTASLSLSMKQRDIGVAWAELERVVGTTVNSQERGVK